MNKISDFFHQFPSSHFKENKTIIRAAQEPPGIFYLENGYVRQTLTSETGVELTLHIYDPGAFFPLFWALGNLENKYDYQAITDLDVFQAPKNEVLNFLKNEPEASFQLARRLTLGLANLAKRVETQTFKDASGRVASILLYLAKHFGETTKEGTVITPKFTHQKIASLVGVTRERVSLEIEKLSTTGLIKHKTRLIIIPDPKKLERKLSQT